MFTISKEFHFSASHVLQGLPAGHPCGRLHGHNYVVTIYLSAPELDGRGFVVEYGELDMLEEYIDDTLDHRHLNDVYPFTPTAENLAKCIYWFCVEHWIQTLAVKVQETPKTSATFAMGGPHD